MVPLNMQSLRAGWVSGQASLSLGPIVWACFIIFFEMGVVFKDNALGRLTHGSSPKSLLLVSFETVCCVEALCELPWVSDLPLY